MEKQKNNYLKYLALITFIAMIIVNVLANYIPIGGVTTGEVSNMYPNLITPANYTFGIWTLIYTLLGLYTLYVNGLIYKNKCSVNNNLVKEINLFFIISSLANIAWIFAWHNDYIILSVALIVIILISLIVITQILQKINLTKCEKFLIKVPFFIYLGWITFATIANITVMFVYVGFNGLGLSDTIWAIIVLILGLIIGLITLFKSKCVVYGLTLIWAYAGVLVKHISADGFANNYPLIVITIAICIGLLAISSLYLFIKHKKSEHVFYNN